MNILLTGGAGYIGSHTALSLIEKGNSVSIIDNLTTGSKKLIPNKAKYYKCDIADQKLIQKIISDNNFNLVIHFAGLTRVDESIRYPDKYDYNNFEKSKIFFESCINNKIKNIIFSSTASVYGDNNSSYIKETENLNPMNPYAKSKLKIEEYLIQKAKEKKISYIILRYFNVAGADIKNRSGLISKNSSNLVKVLCEVATNKRDKITINGNDYKTKDGTAIRDFIHVSDIADMHYVVAKFMLKETFSDVYNCGYGSGYSVKEVIKEMEKILTKKLKVDIGPRRKNDIPISIANADKFKKKFNWKPKFNNLNYILTTALDWEKKLK